MKLPFSPGLTTAKPGTVVLFQVIALLLKYPSSATRVEVSRASASKVVVITTLVRPTIPVFSYSILRLSSSHELALISSFSLTPNFNSTAGFIILTPSDDLA